MQIPLLLFCLYIYSLSGIPAHAQSPGSYTTRGQCIDHCHQYENSLYLQTLKAATRASTWCYYWYRECTCISMDCGSFQIKCQYVGISSDDENCTVREINLSQMSWPSRLISRFQGSMPMLFLQGLWFQDLLHRLRPLAQGSLHK